MAPILKTIKLPGGLEVELRELREELDQTRGEVKSVAIQAQVGAAALDSPRRESLKTAADGASISSLRALGAEYERVRGSMPSGSARTDAMTRMVAAMLKQAAALPPDMDVSALLASQSCGERLVAIAFVHAHPSAQCVSPLVDMLLEVETTPFGQYWALRALHRIAELDAGAFLPNHVEKLRRYRNSQRSDTDRHFEVTRLLRDLSADPSTPS